FVHLGRQAGDAHAEFARLFLQGRQFLKKAPTDQGSSNQQHAQQQPEEPLFGVGGANPHRHAQRHLGDGRWLLVTHCRIPSIENRSLTSSLAPDALAVSLLIQRLTSTPLPALVADSFSLLASSNVR